MDIPVKLAASSETDLIKITGMERKLDEDPPWTNSSESLPPDIVVFQDNTEIAEEIILDNSSSASNVTIEVEEDEEEESEEEEEKVNSDFETQTPSGSFPPMSIEKFENDDAGIHFYTGLETFAKFSMVLQTLSPAACDLNYVRHPVTDISVPNQFFLVLLKLRRNLNDFELSRLFNISEETVSNVFLTWVMFMSLQWRELDLWPSEFPGKCLSSSACESRSSSTRLIIDCIEFPIKKPELLESRRATFSTRENRYTVKVLVGATSKGLISYVSQAYGGAAADGQIVEQSLSDLNVSGNAQLADLQDTIVNKNEHSHENGNRISCATRVCEICSDKDYIERIIRQAKSFKILTVPMNSLETKMASHIAFVCFMLCNFKKVYC